MLAFVGNIATEAVVVKPLRVGSIFILFKNIFELFGVFLNNIEAVRRF